MSVEEVKATDFCLIYSPVAHFQRLNNQTT